MATDLMRRALPGRESAGWGADLGLWRFSNRMGPKGATTSIDLLVSQMAKRQHGVVSLTELLTLGVTERAVSRRVQAGRFHRVHRGVYAVGHSGLTKEGRWLAAVFACGRGPALSHRSAAALWGMAPVPGRPIDVTFPRPPGVAVALA
jgi:predicted transcriptional regulator of viral defense system